MIDIFTNSFGEMCKAIARSFPYLFNNLFINDGHINGYTQILLLGLIVSIFVWIFKSITERTIKRCQRQKR